MLLLCVSAVAVPLALHLKTIFSTEIAFETDENALESILNNEGVTNKLMIKSNASNVSYFHSFFSYKFIFQAGFRN